MGRIVRAVPGHRAQRGVSLVEAVVASALLGIGVAGGITAWDTATTGAGKAVRLAWARCIVRSEIDAIGSAPFSATYASPDPSVAVSVTATARAGEQRVTVTARDPQTDMLLFQASILKTAVLAGQKDINNQPGIVTDVEYGCPAP